jgi:myo-inositol-1(or 4)-monophosphatase
VSVSDRLAELDLRALRDVAEQAALAGGAVVADNFGAARQIRTKAPGDWVSEVDINSEAAVRSVLSIETGLPVFGEEKGGERAEVGWLVDPLDGTANFLHGLEAVGVSVGLVVDGEPVVGVVHAPLLGRTYSAVKGEGSTRDGVPIRTSTRDADTAICATGFPFRDHAVLPRYLRMFNAAITRFEDLRRIGGASLDLCWTAEGVFDGFFELRLGPWDVAAGSLIVREAGGIVTDWEGDDRNWLATGNILAAPPLVHRVLRELVAATGNSVDPA